MTVVWSELPDDVKLRQQAKELGLPQMPPPPAANATVVLFLDEQISAVLVEPWSIMTFSFSLSWVPFLLVSSIFWRD